MFPREIRVLELCSQHQHCASCLLGCAAQQHGNARRALGMLVSKPKPAICKDKTPMQTVKHMGRALKTPEEREQFVLEAKVDAVLTSCSKSLPSVRSGLLCYIAFVDSVRPGTARYLPPSIDMLLAWSTAFRCVCCTCSGRKSCASAEGVTEPSRIIAATSKLLAC